MSLILVVLLVGASIVFLNAVVTRSVCSDERRTRAERIAEVGLIWLVPVFGALVALAISAEDPRKVRRSQGVYLGATGAAAAAVSSDS